MFLGGLALAAAILVARPAVLAPALTAFGASFLLFGFHSYRLTSQVFELLVTALALALLVRLVRGQRRSTGAAEPLVVGPFLLFALVATGSLLLLPRAVLEHRLFLEGWGFGRAILGAFPKDPLYPIAAVDRLCLFGLCAWLLAAQAEARGLQRALLRGIAWSAIAASLLGLLDFAGAISLDRYNLANLFYGSRYRRLQSTFGNPSWFACFVACALPFVWLEFQEARGRARFLLALAFPVCAASLFLSGARASWVAAFVVAVALGAAMLVLGRSGGTFEPGGPASGRALESSGPAGWRALEPSASAGWLALGSTLATIAALVAFAASTPATNQPGQDVPLSRLEGLSRELGYRGLGLQSPRRVAAAYALELAKLSPWLGLGYESFNMHLRAQLEIPGSGVARVVNTAVAYDTAETVFDDSHDTYLQVFTGTGALGLLAWLALVLGGAWIAGRALRRRPTPQALAVLLGLVAFHAYGLFQGMAYIPVTFFLLPLLLGSAVALDEAPAAGATLDGNPGRPPRTMRRWLAGAAGIAALAAAAYARDNGYASLKRRLGVAAYLPDEAATYEGFYRAESGPSGEFRWTARRAIVNVANARPFTLRVVCEHPDAEREPVVVSLRFEGRDLEPLVFRRPGAIERRFAFETPGALRLSVSRTFRPGAGDRRELGVAVSAIRWD